MQLLVVMVTKMGNTSTGGLNEIVSAAFASDGTLPCGHTNKTLKITVDVNDGSSTVIWNHNGPGIANWEGLAWSPDGKYLYGASLIMYRYDPTDQSVTQVCDDNFLPDATEALDFRFDGQMLGGWHNATQGALSIFEIDLATCTVLPADF